LLLPALLILLYSVHFLTSLLFIVSLLVASLHSRCCVRPYTVAGVRAYIHKLAANGHIVCIMHIIDFKMYFLRITSVFSIYFRGKEVQHGQGLY
jgi:hypothetical protein